jgi:hypothetical protein
MLQVGAGLAAIRFARFAVIWQLVSIELKPLPCSFICVWIGPSVGVTEITVAPDVTVKIAEATAPLDVPVTSTS